MKKSRQVRHTIFIYCEGKEDRLFIQHLKKLYLLRGIKKITLKKGTGGALPTFISETANNAQVRDYDEKYIVLDSDNKTEKELKKLEKTHFTNKTKDIQLIWQKPCLEGVFLRILKGHQFTKEKSASCKVIFHKEYANNNPLTEELLDQLFIKSLLDQKRQEVPELNQLIQLMEEKKRSF